ncbi:MAG: hypothetical protein WC222_01515 [Parachlamydiales bacterium]|jgi:hypothetical protein
MSNFFSTLTGKKVAGDVCKSNVMVSVNWVVSFCLTLFGTGVVAGPSHWIQIFSAALIVVLLVFYCGLVIYFAILDPSRLQSERYNLEMHAINALYKDTIDDKSKLTIPPQNPPTIQKSSQP